MITKIQKKIYSYSETSFFVNAILGLTFSHCPLSIEVQCPSFSLSCDDPERDALHDCRICSVNDHGSQYVTEKRSLTIGQRYP